MARRDAQEPTSPAEQEAGRSEPAADTPGQQTTAMTSSEVDDLNAREEQLSAELGGDQLTGVLEQEWERGYRGEVVDPTPNENYTVAGVTGEPAPTPETDADTFRAAQEATRLRGFRA